MAERPKTVGLMQDVFAADGDMAQGPVFCAHPIGRSPQANAGFQKVGQRGASAAEQEFIQDGRYCGLSGDGLPFAGRVPFSPRFEMLHLSRGLPS